MTQKTALRQGLFKGVHYHIFDIPEQALEAITDINSAQLVSIPGEMCVNVATTKSYVDKAISAGDSVNVLKALLAKESSSG